MKIFDIQIGNIEVPNHWSLNIYFSGCVNNKKCNRELCQNKELHSFSKGIDYEEYISYIKYKLKQSIGFINSICLLGGEPFDQNLDKLKDFVSEINKDFNYPIYAYSGYDIDNIGHIMKYKQEINIRDVYIGEYQEGQMNQYWLSQK